MKWLACVLLTCAALPAAELAGVRAVYLFPMAHGMDQYLANSLTNGHLFRVVTDPKLADAFFSDRVGESLQAQIERALAKPKETPKDAAKAAGKEPGKDAPKDADAPKSVKSDSRNPAAMFGDTANKLDNPSMNSSFGRGQGNIFLVDAKTREVVWSTFDLPKDSSGQQLDHTASDIVARLKKELNPKGKQ